MSKMTGHDEPVVAFDCDGTLNNMGVSVIGQDNGQKWDTYPIWVLQQLGCTVCVYTCNVVDFVVDELRKQDIDAYPDPDITDPQYKCPPNNGRVMVTNRKPLADLYVDDNALRWKCGDPLWKITNLLSGQVGILPRDVWRGMLSK
jgi:hypothetical protein